MSLITSKGDQSYVSCRKPRAVSTERKQGMSGMILPMPCGMVNLRRRTLSDPKSRQKPAFGVCILLSTEGKITVRNNLTNKKLFFGYSNYKSNKYFEVK